MQTPAPPNPPDALAPGSSLGRYQLRRIIGRGSTSTVWLAWDPQTQREVAIKCIDPDVLNDHARGRLHRNLLINEASLADKLQHPHIVAIHDAVVTGDQAYIVMEYVAGGTLEAHVQRPGLLPVERIVELMFKCTRALDYACQLGITHRDIKPANILLTRDGELKLTDFGAALFTANERTQVEGVGSPAYMSPQQVREMPLNHQTDIYSLGVVLYQLLAGELPFQASNKYSLVYQIIHVEPPPPSVHRPGLPPALDAVVARAMQKDIALRYATWAEFTHDLAQAFRNRRLKPREDESGAAEHFRLLRTLTFFNEFSDVELWEVAHFAHQERVAAGTVLMKDGEQGDRLYVLVEGELAVCKSGRTLNILTSGECCGEMSVIARRDRKLRANDVQANTDSLLFAIDGERIRRASETCRMRFYEAFLQVLAARLSSANMRLADSWGGGE
ncbi:serine/threonine-protein kinase [Methyloversatilis discipulorum]|uniref:serine/threonine-protein kinase n=1 Tax=Methyloversatilis discipulorum TaxID=1119528 RepID=UPI001A58F29C|nr:serine/threonine-protein kinase [Methyloversatilis discipulorum]MBL8467518.1 protein kinase [Methyloversatilis discipulorum]